VVPRFFKQEIMNEKEELVQRWDVFLTKIEERFNELMNTAVQATDKVVEQLEYDNSIVVNAWSGIQAQIRKLQDKMESVWEEKMDDLFGMREDVSSDDRLGQMYKYEDLSKRMDTEYLRAKTKVLANAGRKIIANVNRHIDTNKMHACKQCGAPMDIRIYSFVARNVKCGACATVNSYEPDSRVRALEHFAIVQLADELVIDQSVREEEIGHEIWKLDERKPHEAVKVEALRKELVIVRKNRLATYYRFLMDQVPDKADSYQSKLNERLKWAESV